MKALIKIFVIVFTLSVGILNAQPPQRTPEERAKRETERVKEQVALTDSQAVKYEQIALKYAKMRGVFRDIPRDSVALFRQKMNELNDKKKVEVKQILSAEQFAKYEKWMEENRNRMGRGGNSQPSN